MRDREVIEREMFRAREDLEQSITELKHVVREKIDVKARARVALERAEGKAYEAYERGKDGVRDLVLRGKDGAVDIYVKAKERPALTRAIIGGVVAAGALIYIGRQKHWW